MLEEEIIDSLAEKARKAFDIMIKVHSKAHLSKEPLSNASSVLIYLSSENLVKETKTLNFWTKVIAGTAIVMILVTITQIILMFAC